MAVSEEDDRYLLYRPAAVGVRVVDPAHGLRVPNNGVGGMQLVISQRPRVHEVHYRVFQFGLQLRLMGLQNHLHISGVTVNRHEFNIWHRVGQCSPGVRITAVPRPIVLEVWGCGAATFIWFLARHARCSLGPCRIILGFIAFPVLLRIPEPNASNPEHFFG